MTKSLTNKRRYGLETCRTLIKENLNVIAEFGLTDLDYYQYLSYGGNYRVDGTNDARDFQETLKGN